MNPQRLATLQQLLEQTPGDPFLLYAIALEFASGGDVQRAVNQLEDLKIQHPDYLATYYQLGKFHEQLQQEEMAAVVYQEGVELARSQGDRKTLSELQAALDLL